jgi:hypothetical protein
MKSLVLAAVLAFVNSAAALHVQPAGNIPNYPGIQFDKDGKLSITVFSDLHFGERGLSVIPSSFVADKTSL